MHHNKEDACGLAARAEASKLYVPAQMWERKMVGFGEQIHSLGSRGRLLDKSRPRWV